MAFGALSFGGGYLTAPFERWFDVLRSPQISDAPDRAAQLSRYRHARARPGILQIWSTPRRPACSANGMRGIERMVFRLRPLEQMKLQEARNRIEIRIPSQPHFFKCVLGTFFHPKPVHGNEHLLVSC